MHCTGELSSKLSQSTDKQSDVQACTLIKAFSALGRVRSRETMVVFVDISKQSEEQSWRTRRKMFAADEQVNVVRV